METKRNLPDNISEENVKHFYIEAAINEEGPKSLLVLPAEDEYTVYDNRQFLCRLKVKEDEDWEVVEEEVTPGAANEIEKAIKKAIKID